MASFPITPRNRWVYFGLTYAYVITLYMVSNHYQIFPKHFLPLTPIDVNCPYLPWTGWIYVLVYFIPLFCAVVLREEDGIRRLIYSFVAMTTLCTLIFVLYPTVYPRPTEEVVSSLANWPIIWVHALDTPANSMPSQHVAAAFLSAFFIHRYRKSWGNIAIIMSILISISTLTTKQHYVWDVVIGYAIARFSYLIATVWSCQPSRSGSHSEVAR